MRLVLYMYTNKIVVLNSWTTPCLKRYIIIHPLNISSGKYLRRSSWITNPKHHTSMSLAVKPMCSSLVKFMLINVCHFLNWWYENNRYHFICYIQENIISHFIHAIFNERLFPKCTDSYTKEHKLYDKLLDKISSETKLLVPDSFRKDRPAPVSTSHTSNPPVQNNPLTHSSSPFLSYKSTSLPSILRFKKPTVEIEEDNDVDSDVEIQLPSPQWPLQPAL